MTAALANDTRWDTVAPRCRRCALARAIRKDVNLREANITCHAAGGREVCIGFPGEADNDIGCERRVIERVANTSASFEKTRAAVAPLHALENAIGAALQAEMQMRTNAWPLGQDAYEIATCLCRFQAAQSDAKIAGETVESFKQVPETGPFRLWSAAAEIDAVMAEMNACENDLVVSRGDKAFNFCCDFFDRPTANRRPNRWDDAVTAIQQAAVLDFDEGSLMIVEARDARRYGHDTERLQFLDQAIFIGDDRSNAGQTADGVRISRGVAAHDDNRRTGILGVQTTNQLPALRVAFARDSAGVDKAKIGRFFANGRGVAGAF